MKGNLEQPGSNPLYNFADEDAELLSEFIVESTQSLEEAETLLLQLEKTIAAAKTDISEPINIIFRSIHSMKGNAGFLGLSQIGEVTHHTETLLDLIRKEALCLQKEHIDLLLEAIDLLVRLLDNLNENSSEDGCENPVKQLILQLNHFTGDDETKTVSGKSSRQAAEPDGTQPNTGKDETHTAHSISPEDVKQYIQHTRHLLEVLDNDLHTLETSPGDSKLIENVLRTFYTIKTSSEIFEYTDISKICHKVENFLETAQTSELPTTKEQVSLLVSIPGFISAALDDLENDKQPKILGLPGILTLMDETLPGKNDGEADDSETQETKDSQAVEETNPSAETKEPPAVSAKQATPQGNSLPKSTANEVIRVDVRKLDDLMDLIGEIVISESMVTQHFHLAAYHNPDFEKGVMRLRKNIREIQEIATSMRMVPLAGVFKKMVRLVRDLANKSEKIVELQLVGKDTEVDRSVIEHISDPLVHILRNSVDHGIEKPEMRKQAGKPESGKIVLEAKQVGSEIWISVSDDGNGLDRQKIVDKAIQKGILKNDDKSLPNQDIWNLIFTPGFSTSEAVTTVSGRGVGMDVVRRNIEKIRGKIDVQSKDKTGTTINLRIPLTTAIIECMLIQVGESIYAVPISDIIESFRVSEMNLHRLISGQEVVNIRNKLTPVIRLSEIHQNKKFKREDPLSILIETVAGNTHACLYADRLLDQRQLVIKPTPKYLGSLAGVSGCAILGNGDICLIIDMENLIAAINKKSGHQEKQYDREPAVCL